MTSDDTPRNMRVGLQQAAFLVFAVLAFRNVSDSTESLAKAFRRAFRDRFSHLARIADTPDFGSEILPAEAREIRTIVLEHALKDYALSAELRDNATIFQRVVEACWPAVESPTSAHLFSPNGSTTAAHCLVQKTTGTISYASCK